MTYHLISVNYAARYYLGLERYTDLGVGAKNACGGYLYSNYSTSTSHARVQLAASAAYILLYLSSKRLDFELQVQC